MTSPAFNLSHPSVLHKIWQAVPAAFCRETNTSWGRCIVLGLMDLKSERHCALRALYCYGLQVAFWRMIIWAHASLVPPIQQPPTLPYPLLDYLSTPPLTFPRH